MPTSMEFENHFLKTRDVILGWFGRSGHADDADTILRDAFIVAKGYILGDLPKKDQVVIFAERPQSVTDFTDILLATRSRYASRNNTKVYTWLEKLSSRIVYYGTVLDVLVQHHPEYASLAWGAFKFLFIAVQNHEEMTKQLAKACSRIGECLPRADLSLILYPTAAMQEAVARLYAIIMRFIVRGLRWYRQGRARHLISSITSPWALDFAQELREVEQQAKSVEELAQSASRAELRETRFQIHQTRSELEAARGEIKQLTHFVEDSFKRMTELALETRSLQVKTFNDVTSSKDMLYHIQLTQILSLSFMESLPTSGQCLAYSRSFCLRRQALRRDSGMIVPDSNSVQEWGNQKSLSFVITKTRSQICAKDLVVEMISLFQNHGLPVLWALRPPNLQNSSLTTIDVIRMLFYQALQINSSALTASHPITVAQLREASSHEDWMLLLGRAVQGLPTIYVIFESELVDHVTNGDKSLATKFLVEFASFLGPATAKFIVSSHTFETSYAEQCLGVDAITAVKSEEHRRNLNSLKRQRGRKCRSK